MDGNNYVVFHTAVDDSYMNSSANFRGADVTGNTEITMYFASATSSQSGSFDSVALNITAGTEIAVIETLAAAMAGAKNPVMVIADDINSTYVADGITSCGTITVLGGNKAVVKLITGDTTLYNYDSGKIVQINPAATSLIQLPGAAVGGAGWNCRIVLTEDDGGAMDQIVNIGTLAGEFFNGILVGADAGGSLTANGTSNDFINCKATSTSGEEFFIYSDGTRMHVSGIIIDASDTLFADTAAS